MIVATGANARWLDLANEQRLRGHGVSACATCDGFFFKGKDVVAVGGGDSAMEESTFLTRFANSVTVVHRRPELRASRIMQDRARSNPKIRLRLESEVTDVLGADSVTGVVVRDIPTGNQETLPVQGLFLAIGHDPATEVFRGALDLDRRGYLLTTEIDADLRRGGLRRRRRLRPPVPPGGQRRGTRVHGGARRGEVARVARRATPPADGPGRPPILAPRGSL